MCKLKLYTSTLIESNILVNAALVEQYELLNPGFNFAAILEIITIYASFLEIILLCFSMKETIG